MTEGRVLAAYDTRGIQNYVYRIPRIGDAVGASKIVDKIIDDALHDARDQIKKEDPGLDVVLEWKDKDWNALPFKGTADVETLYIGGGNAFVMYSGRDLALKFNRLMSRYILDKTYGMQLACALTPVTGNYADDYDALHKELDRIKETMVYSHPLGALPVMQTEIRTGFPAVHVQEGTVEGTETYLKRKERLKSDPEDKERRYLDSYVTEKGKDSMLAVVHIDGNSMAMRIKSVLSGGTSYEESVDTMRRLSIRITRSYTDTFNEMRNFFEKTASENTHLNKGAKHFLVRSIITAGDDITYVCNGNIAMATVEYFTDKITRRTMFGDPDNPEDLKKYGFSICAGIAYMGSHFPFDIAYDIAESCCDSAKDRAKEEANSDTVEMSKDFSVQKIGNYVDFEICKNVMARDLEETRKREYHTRSDEELMLRPFYIPVGADQGTKIAEAAEKPWSIEPFLDAICYFNRPETEDGEYLPRSFSKQLRNTYSLGEEQVKLLCSFLRSRGWTLPDGTVDAYVMVNGKKTAKYYDALELMDNYRDLSEFMNEEDEKGGEE